MKSEFAARQTHGGWIKLAGSKGQLETCWHTEAFSYHMYSHVRLPEKNITIKNMLLIICAWIYYMLSFNIYPLFPAPPKTTGFCLEKQKSACKSLRASWMRPLLLQSHKRISRMKLICGRSCFNWPSLGKWHVNSWNLEDLLEIDMDGLL